MHPITRTAWLANIGEVALEFEAARIDEFEAREVKRKIMKEIHLDDGIYARGDNEDADFIVDEHLAAAKRKANARRKLTRAIMNFHRCVKALA